MREWSLIWRRELLEWEVQLSEEMRLLLSQFTLDKDATDTLWRNFESNGRFAVKLFSRTVARDAVYDEKCVFCGDDNESVEHMFMSCKIKGVGVKVDGYRRSACWIMGNFVCSSYLVSLEQEEQNNF